MTRLTTADGETMPGLLVGDSVWVTIGLDGHRRRIEGEVLEISADCVRVHLSELPERRRHPRRRRQLEVGLDLIGVASVASGTTEDVSAGGLCIRSRASLEPGQHGVVVVRPPGETALPIAARVEVIDHGEPDEGGWHTVRVRIAAISERNRERLDAVLD
jgi:hypothetical protein